MLMPHKQQQAGLDMWPNRVQATLEQNKKGKGRFIFVFWHLRVKETLKNKLVSLGSFQVQEQSRVLPFASKCWHLRASPVIFSKSDTS